MALRIFCSTLIAMAALLAVVMGPLSASAGKGGSLAIVFAETIEDVEEDGERDDLVACPADSGMESAAEICSLAVVMLIADAPIVCGPHNERGPPAA